MTERVIVAPQAAQEPFLSSASDIAIYGGAAGAGKTYSLLMKPLEFRDLPGFRAVFFRRTRPELCAAGGPWEDSHRLYAPLGASPREQLLDWRFPSGASVAMSHMEHKDDRYAWKGAQIAEVLFDQLESFEAEQFWYLLGRCRDPSGKVRPHVRGSCNPDPDSFLARLLAWWIDQETGYPIPDRAGRERWFVRDERGDELLWEDRREDFKREEQQRFARSLAFFPATLEDNPMLRARDPGYEARLALLPLVERERLRRGNWKVRQAAGKVFRREWLRLCRAAPADARRARGWDFAGTSKKELGSSDPDYTAHLKLAFDGSRFYVDHAGRFRESPGQVKQALVRTAEIDGHDCRVAIFQDPAQAGKFQAQDFVLALAGYAVDVFPATKNVPTMAEPISAQAEAGNLWLVEGPWVEEFIRELEAFPDGAHDDWVAALAAAFMSLAGGRGAANYDLL